MIGGRLTPRTVPLHREAFAWTSFEAPLHRSKRLETFGPLLEDM